MISEIMARLQVTRTQVEMAYYSGALPKTIDPEPYIKRWEEKLAERRSRNKPIGTINDSLI